MLDLTGKKVLVLGLGVTGRSAANFCAAQGATVVAADERSVAELDDVSELGAGISLAVGKPFPDPGGFDLVVPSPGVPPARYHERARRVWGDIELAHRALAIPIVAVTGTNGKSTVTCLLEFLLRSAGLRAEAAGNLGRPALSLVGQPLDLAVLEVSSFQLDAVVEFRPRVALILNLSPDHLDRHARFEAYRDAKGRILDAQHPDDAAVLNRDDPAVWSLAARTRGRVYGFSATRSVERGGWWDCGSVVLREGETRLRVNLDGLRLPGRHNLENTLAALTAVFALGVDVVQAARALDGFRGLRHRMEFIREVGGVAYVNDSKATNVAAVVRALESFERPIVWIAGGRDKGADFSPLADAAAARVRAALLIGEAALALEKTLSGRIACEPCATLDEAVRRAALLAEPGDLVLLSPGCSSFDQFSNFEERGDCFRAAVEKLVEREVCA